ncbi:MAG TPA: ABC transporter substrate-binding protein [Vicinamibacterales bacterium]|nr:ABC transporter substrate-binding protein [Vicinamibacterales bacterium]
MPRIIAQATGAAVGLLILSGYTLACSSQEATTRLTISGSALGPEADVVQRQLARFAERRPEVRVELQVTPDSADQRHQLFVQWLNAHSPSPDVLQLDVIWIAEFAAAGWILPLDRFEPGIDDFLPASVATARWRGRLYSIPWFVDVGMLYWRTDLLDRAPRSLVELRQEALRVREAESARFGLVWQGARYEGLVTVFLEHLAAFGGGILDDRGRVIVDDPAAIRALTFMANAVNVDRVVPSSALTWQEEQVRFAFQNGEAAFMRNWPYAWALLQDESRSRVARRFAVAPFPAEEGGQPAAALGGAQLAINGRSAHPTLASELVAFLAAPEQMIERARLTGQLPARRSLYDSAELVAALPIPLEQVRPILEAAVPRPATPVYSELSEILQVSIHRALTRQQPPAVALQEAGREMRALLARAGLSMEGPAR